MTLRRFALIILIGFFPGSNPALANDDHGNARSTATQVALPSETTGTIDPGNDTDWFRFEVRARGVVVMESSGDLDTLGTLFDASRNYIVGDDDADGDGVPDRFDEGVWHPNFRFERELDAGTYYIRVRSYLAALGGYTLHLRRDGSGDRGEGEGGDHGNFRSTATRVALPSATAGTIDPGTDTDWFRFEVSATGVVVMESSSELDTLGTLFDASGDRIVQDDDSGFRGNFRIEQTLDAGTYYIRVHSYQTSTGGYTLHLRGDGSGGEGDDHGNSSSAATGVALPSTTAGTIEPGDDTDWFRFDVWARGVVVMESSGDLDTLGTLFGANGDSIVQDDDGGDELNFRIERTLGVGIYYVRVHSYQMATGGYTLHLREDGSDSGGEGGDHGNSRSTATSVALPSTTTGTIDPGTDTDWFRFEVSARGVVVMESSGDLDTLGTLFDAGSRIVQDDDGGDELNFRIERTLDAGAYYVRVHSSGTATGGYTLHLRGDGGGGSATVAPGESFRDCDTCPLMVSVPAGSFSMGAPESEPHSRSNERPQRTVSVPAFAVGAYEVTFAEWDRCVAEGGCGGYSPHDGGWGRDDRPVINVSWDDAQLYVAWLSRETGQTYRLPTEAEWEYAARAGTTTPFHTGGTISSQQANFDGQHGYPLGSNGGGLYRGQTVPVGSFAPNAFGLHDVHGNVNEWVQDCYGSYWNAPRDGRASEGGDCSVRVVRGGTWHYYPWGLRSAARFGTSTAPLRSDGLGFRVVRTLAP